MPPLINVRVVELSTSAAAQVSGMLLSDLGADVVRVVDAEDDQRIGRPAWACWNRGKRLVADRTDLDRLLTIADVLLSDAPPRRHRDDRLDADSLSARAPGLTSVWMPPTGRCGAWSELPADHILLDGLTGLSGYQQGTSDAPFPTVVPGTHVIQGVLGATAAVAGLLGRAGDGWGRAATVSGLHAAAAASFALGSVSLDGPPALGSAGLLPGPPHMRLYQAGDGQWLYVAAISFEYFVRALEALDRMDLLAHPVLDGDFINVMKPEAMEPIGGEMERAFRSRTRPEWLQILAAHHVPSAEVRPASEWLSSDILAHTSPPTTRTSPTLGDVTLPGPFLIFEVTASVVGDVPDPGAAMESIDVWPDAPPRPAPTGPRPSDAELPLAGLKVVDTTTFMAGPFSGAVLAACGAEVVKVEPPAGDPYATYNAAYTVMNGRKTRVHLNLRDEADRGRLLELVGGADVMIDNLTESSLARLDLSPERIASANPALVRCSVSAYGADGPYAEHPGFDQMVQAMSGLMMAQGGDDRPLAISFPIHDVATGSLVALGSLAAVVAREAGQPAHRVYASLSATAALVQSGEITDYPGRPPRTKGGVDWPGPSPWRRYYQASDRWIAVSATTAEARRALLDVVERADLKASSDRDHATAIAEVLADKPADEWLDALVAAGVPACPVAAKREFDLPYLAENEFADVLEIEDVGRVQVPARFVDWG